MLRDYLKKNRISIYALAGLSGIAYSTLNDLVNGKVRIEQCRVALLRSLSEALGLSMEEVIDLCADKHEHLRTAQGTELSVDVRNKSYYASFEYKDEKIELELCKVREETTYYLDEIATWRAEEYIRERRMAEWE